MDAGGRVPKVGALRRRRSSYREHEGHEEINFTLLNLFLVCEAGKLKLF